MEKRRRVLYISYDGLTDPLGRSQILPYVKRLAKESYDIHILSYDKPSVFEAKSKRIEEELKGTAIHWHPLPYTKSPPVISTLLDLSKGKKKIKELFLSEGPFDLVHCRGYIPALLGLHCLKKYGTPFLFDMRGWWADEKKESGAWANPLFRPVYNYFKRKERLFFSDSAQVISLTESGKNYIASRQLAPLNKISVIPTCVDLQIFKAFDITTRKEIRDRLNILDSSFVMLYSGSLGGNYRTDQLLECFDLLRIVKPDSKLLILSNSSGEKELLELSTTPERKENIIVIKADFQEVNQYLIAADLGVIFYDRAFSSIGRSPTKLGEYWACGLPFISLSGTGDLDIILKKYPLGGALLDNLDEQNFNAAFRMLFENPTDQKALRAYASDYFDVEKGSNVYLKIYNNSILPH